MDRLETTSDSPRRGLIPRLLAAWLASTVVAAVGLSRTSESPPPSAHAVGEAIAEAELARLAALAFDAEALVPRSGPAPWIHVAGLARGELRVPFLEVDGTTGSVLYRVVVDVEALDAESRFRRLSVRVAWSDPITGGAQTVERATLRAGHAE